MAIVTDIQFSQIPRQSALFLEYLKLSPDALHFYQRTPTLESIAAAVRPVLDTVQFQRSTIASILRRQNSLFGCDGITLARIDELEKPGCVAILTGQQVGLFTGPLYTIYKALTAIRLADELKQKGIPAVPIFWMDTEDHDLAEVTHRTVLNPDSSIRRIQFKDFLFGGMPSGPVGSIRFPDSMIEAVQEYLDGIPDGIGKEEVRSQLQGSCRPGVTFCQSFAELLFRTLPGLGLILFDPHDSEAKRLTASVFETALRNSETFRAALLSRNRELEAAGFHSQVSVADNSTVLFMIEGGERRALEQKESGFFLRNTNRTFTLDELLDCANRTPEKFSPNVLLRPIVQDHLFPSVAYVGGSAELAYFAQIHALYELYGRPMPVIWPRDGFTLVEPEISSEMDRIGIEIRDCFQGPQYVLEKAARNTNPSQAPAVLEDLKTQLDQVLTEIKPELQAVEPPLAEALETARRKILHNVQHLNSQLLRLERTDAPSSVASAVDRVINNCYPFQTLQERELGIHHFFARHGSSLLSTIRSAINVSSFAHRVIRL